MGKVIAFGLLFTASLSVPAISSAPTSGTRGIIVSISGERVITKYAVDLSPLGSRQIGAEPWDPDHEQALIKLLTQRQLRGTAEKGAAATLKSPDKGLVDSACISPDGKYALEFILVPRPPSAPDAETYLVRLRDAAVIARLPAEENFNDCEWLPDSSRIAILEYIEHVSLSPLNLLSALSGHPVQLTTFYLLLVDPVTHAQQRTLIASDVPNPSSLMDWGPQQ